MKQYFLLILMMFAVIGSKADTPDIIYNQPEGKLCIYERQGSTLTENSETGEIALGTQESTISIVFASGNEVYIQDPVSGYTMSGTWVKGILSPDGHKITLPLGQYIDYTRSFDMAYQLQMLNYDADEGTYVYDESVTSITYTLTDDGKISLDGSSQQHILGLIFRTFGNPQGAAIGQDFMYLNYVWIGVGDFDSSYTLMDLQVQQPPAGLKSSIYYATSAEYDGAAYSPSQEIVRIGQDGTDVWIQGISRLLPSAWARGTLKDGKISLPTGQFLGTLEGIALFLHGASLDAEGSFGIKDIEISTDGQEYYTYDYLFVTTSASSLQYVNFYMGMTYSPSQEKPIEAPATLNPVVYTLKHSGGQVFVRAGFSGNDFYVQGVWEGLPSAWIKGTITGNKATFAVPQFLGYYEDSGTMYPIYFTAFDSETGQPLRQLTFSYDPVNFDLTDASSPIAIGINKTGYLSVNDYYAASFLCDDPDGITPIAHGTETADQLYRLDGTPAGRHPRRGLYIMKGKKIFLK